MGDVWWMDGGGVSGFCGGLLTHSSLKDDDLAGRMGLQLKELNKIMATLETHKLVRA